MIPATTQELVQAARQPDQRLRLLHRHALQGRRVRRGDSLRLNLVAAWREATVFTDAERAALELAEQGTRIADAAGGVSDEAWANAAKYYDEHQLAALVSAHRLHQRLEPPERHHPAARRRLPGWPVRLTVGWRGPSPVPHRRSL